MRNPCVSLPTGQNYFTAAATSANATERIAVKRAQIIKRQYVNSVTRDSLDLMSRRHLVLSEMVYKFEGGLSRGDKLSESFSFYWN